MSDKDYVESKDRSAAYLLFHKYYLWLVPQGELWDINDTEYYGVMTTGDEEWDKELSEVRVPQYLKTSDAAAMMAEGIEMTLSDPKDAVAIYNTIAEHLKDWLKSLRRSTGGAMSKTKVPIQGLREFNTMASHLAVIGRRHGLVEHFDPYKKLREMRSIHLEHHRVPELKDYHHSDEVFEDILRLSRK